MNLFKLALYSRISLSCVNKIVSLLLAAICLHFQITGDAGEIVDSAPTGEQIIEAKGVLVKT